MGAIKELSKMFYVEMELLARERQETLLREAVEVRLHRNLVARVPKTARSGRRVRMPRLRQK
jgi:hypothetical protein